MVISFASGQKVRGSILAYKNPTAEPRINPVTSWPPGNDVTTESKGGPFFPTLSWNWFSKILVRINLPLFSTVVPSNICMFLSCRPFVVITTFSYLVFKIWVSKIPCNSKTYLPVWSMKEFLLFRILEFVFPVGAIYFVNSIQLRTIANKFIHTRIWKAPVINRCLLNRSFLLNASIHSLINH